VDGEEFVRNHAQFNPDIPLVSVINQADWDEGLHGNANNPPEQTTSLFFMRFQRE